MASTGQMLTIQREPLAGLEDNGAAASEPTGANPMSLQVLENLNPPTRVTLDLADVFQHPLMICERPMGKIEAEHAYPLFHHARHDARLGTGRPQRGNDSSSHRGECTMSRAGLTVMSVVHLFKEVRVIRQLRAIHWNGQ